MNVFLYDKYKKYGGNMLDIIYEDKNMIVVNKPAGQLVPVSYTHLTLPTIA